VQIVMQMCNVYCTCAGQRVGLIKMFEGSRGRNIVSTTGRGGRDTKNRRKGNIYRIKNREKKTRPTVSVYALSQTVSAIKYIIARWRLARTSVGIIMIHTCAICSTRAFTIQCARVVYMYKTRVVTVRL